VGRCCVWSRNLENEEAKARYRAVKLQPQWVVTPGKQTTKKAVEIKKKNHHEAYNVRHKGLNSFQGLKMADYHGRNIES